MHGFLDEPLGRFAVNLVFGGILSLFVARLFKARASTVANRDEFGSVLPLFTLSTIVVITVVQSSLALSLGMIGALSIVRFRAAIKSPEELVYLLFCVAIGLAVGADQRVLALAAVVVVSLFVFSGRFANRPAGRSLLLSVAGEGASFFPQGGPNVLQRVERMTRGFTLDRLDHHADQASLRGVVTVEDDSEARALMARLSEEMPEFRLSYVDLDDIV